MACVRCGKKVEDFLTNKTYCLKCLNEIDKEWDKERRKK